VILLVTRQVEGDQAQGDVERYPTSDGARLTNCRMVVCAVSNEIDAAPAASGMVYFGRRLRYRKKWLISG